MSDTKTSYVPQSQKLAPELGYRLASLIDGEGCFTIARQVRSNRAPVYGCNFTIAMREDDVDFLTVFKNATGLGVLYRVTKRGNTWSKPAYYWRIQNKPECLALVHILDAYPLWSKKQRDYAIWREAVLYIHGPRPEGKAPLERWFQEIRDVRQYIPGGELIQPEEVFLAEPLFDVEELA